MPLPWATVPLVLASAGPVLRYDVVYLGSRVGSIEAQSVETEDGWVTTAEARSARWYRPIYDLHDRIRTTWSTEGTVQTQSILREGRYHHDLEQRFGADGVVVENRKRQGRQWHTWTDHLDPHPGTFDPVAAVLLVARRIGAQQALAVPVLSGREVRALRAVRRGTHTETHPVLGDVELHEVDLTTEHRDEISRPGTFVVWVRDGETPTLVRGLLRTPVGKVRVELVAQEAPDG